MKKIIIGFIIGFGFGSSLIALAKTEMGSSDAQSVVAYGYNGGTLVAIKVDSNGVIQAS